MDVTERMDEHPARVGERVGTMQVDVSRVGLSDHERVEILESLVEDLRA